MLKKVMIICLAFSFVFIGGIAFAVDGGSGVLKKGQKISQELADSSEVLGEPTVLKIHDSETTIAEGDELKQGEQPEGAEEKVAEEAKGAKEGGDSQ